MAPNTILTEQITIFCDIRESFQKHVSIRFIFCIFQILFLHNLTWLILNPSFEQKSMNYYVVLYRNTISSYLKATKCLDTIPKKPWLLLRTSISEKGQKRSVLYENTGRPAKLKSTYGKEKSHRRWFCFAVMLQPCCATSTKSHAENLSFENAKRTPSSQRHCGATSSTMTDPLSLLGEKGRREKQHRRRNANPVFCPSESSALKPVWWRWRWHVLHSAAEALLLVHTWLMHEHNDE